MIVELVDHNSLLQEGHDALAVLERQCQLRGIFQSGALNANSAGTSTCLSFILLEFDPNHPAHCAAPSFAKGQSICPPWMDPRFFPVSSYCTVDNLVMDVRKKEEDSIEELFSVADKQSAELLAEIEKQIEHLELVQKGMKAEKARLIIKDEIRALARKESVDFFKDLATIRDDLKELGNAYDRKQWDFSDTHMKKYPKK